MTVDKYSLKENSFTLVWRNPNNKDFSLEYLPSITVANTSMWRNVSEWQNETKHVFDDLKPFTAYTVAVYTRLNKTLVYPPGKFITVSTMQGGKVILHIFFPKSTIKIY